MVKEEGCSGEVVASFDTNTWTPMGHVSHVEAARNFALQEITPRHETIGQIVYTKWIDGETVFRHEVHVGIAVKVTPLRGDKE